MNVKEINGYVVRLEAEGVNAAIAEAHRSEKAFTRAVQEALLAVHAHITLCGDSTGFDRLIAGLSKGTRKNAIKLWIETTTWCVFDEGEDACRKDPSKKMMPIEEAACLLWSSQKADQEEPYKAPKWGSLVKSFETKLVDGIDHNALDADQLQALEIQFARMFKRAYASLEL